MGIGYLAPELIDAQPQKQPRVYTDIYGLGVILYESLSGRPPFAGANAGETLKQVRSQLPIPPSHFNPKVTSGLDAVCMRCLQKNPWERYIRVYNFAKRLEDCLDS